MVDELDRATGSSSSPANIAAAPSTVRSQLRRVEGSKNIVEVGGEREATPLLQSQLIFKAAGLEPKYVNVPLPLLSSVVSTLIAWEAGQRTFRDGVIDALDHWVEGDQCVRESVRVAQFRDALKEALDHWVQSAESVAEAARIAQFYATADMLGPSDPAYCSEKIEDFYENAVENAKQVSAEDLGLVASSVLVSRALTVGLGLLVVTAFGILSGQIGWRPVTNPIIAAATLLASTHLLL
jgi:hypothetical protein